MLRWNYWRGRNVHDNDQLRLDHIDIDHHRFDRDGGYPIDCRRHIADDRRTSHCRTDYDDCEWRLYRRILRDAEECG